MTCISDSQIILDEDDEVAFPCPMRQNPTPSNAILKGAGPARGKT